MGRPTKLDDLVSKRIVDALDDREHVAVRGAELRELLFAIVARGWPLETAADRDVFGLHWLNPRIVF